MRKIIIGFVCIVIVQIVNIAPLFSQSDIQQITQLKKEWWQQSWWNLPPQQVAAAFQDHPAHCGIMWSGNRFDWWTVTFQANISEGNDDIIFAYTCGNQMQITNDAANDIEPTLHIDGKKIVFASNRNGNYELYMIAIDDLITTRLTNTLLDERYPDWSNDGILVYALGSNTSHYQIWTLDVNSGEAKQLTNDEQHNVFPTWTPDGKNILWSKVSANGINAELWKMSRDGSNAQKLADTLPYLGHPKISADGKQILFDGDSNGDGLNDLLLMNADGSNRQVLFASNFDPNRTNYDVYEYLAGGWSPDSNTILYPIISYHVSPGADRLNNIIIRSKCLSPSCFAQDYVFGSRSVYPDMASLDSYPPHSQLKPLAQYSRWRGFVLDWNAQDTGISGLGFYSFEFRKENSNDWTPVPGIGNPTRNQNKQIVAGDLEPGKVYFRMRALDRAENAEPFDSDPNVEISTSLFAGWLKGKVTDNRGIPSPFVALSIQPPMKDSYQTDAKGQFAVPLDYFGIYVLNGSTTLQVDADYERNLYSRPADSLIRDGDMESNTFGDWLSDQAQFSKERYTSGTRAMKMGSDGVFLCTLQSADQEGTAQTLSGDGSFEFPQMIDTVVASNSHSLYVLGKTSYSSGLFLAERTFDGTWSLLEPVVDQLIQSSYWLAVGEDDMVHVIWIDSEQHIMYQSRSGVTWSQPVVAANGRILNFIAGTNGTAHLMYTDSCPFGNCPVIRNVFYQLLEGADTQQNPISILTSAYENVDISYDGLLGIVTFVDTLGNLHMVHGEFYPYEIDYPTPLPPIFYKMRDTSGNWTQSTAIPGVYGTARFLYVDPVGEIHLFFNRWGLHYVTKQDGAWQDEQLLSQNDGDWKLAADSRTNSMSLLHYSWGATEIQAIQIRSGHVALEGESFATTPINWDSLGFVTTKPDSLYIVAPYGYQEARYYEYATPTVAKSSRITLTQALLIPETLHKPTLAFLYTLDGRANTHSFFDVSVTEVVSVSNGSTAISTTQIFSTNTPVPWQLGWADMSPWSGKEISITFAVHQVAGSTPIRVYLDEVSLGSWTTPRPTSLTPTLFEYGEAATLTIRGENFDEKPTVRIGEYVAQNVKRIDETALEIRLPSDLQAGVYFVQVSNQSGQSAIAPTMIAIGKQIYLPLIVR